MVTKGLALILFHNIKQFTNLRHSGNQSMNVENWSSGGVLKKSCNLA